MLNEITVNGIIEYLKTNKEELKGSSWTKPFEDFLEYSINDNIIYQMIISFRRGVITLFYKTKEFNVYNIIQFCEDSEEINAIPISWAENIINNESENIRRIEPNY